MVELMVGVLLSLIVLAGVVFLFSSINNTTSIAVLTGSMQQELREVGQVMFRDIRRAGFSGVVPGQDFNGDALPNPAQNSVGRANSIRADILFNPYLDSTADIKVYNSVGSNDCILFSYNVDADLPGSGVVAAVESDEWLGYRRQVVGGRGMLQMKTAGAGPTSCTSGNTWETISSDEFDVTVLTFTLSTAEIEIANLSGGTVDVCEQNDSCQCIRTVNVDMTVVLDRDNNITMDLANSIRVENDKIAQIRTNLTHCYN